MDLSSILTTLSVAAIPFVFAITVHEVSHGWVAKYFGDRTAEAQGRLTLNPVRHIDPIGTVLMPAVLLLLHAPPFGWAKPVPVNPRYMRDPRTSMIWVSAAGPGANVLMAFAWAFVMLLSQRLDLGLVGHWLMAMAYFGIQINVVLAVFNMLPIPPLDGGQVLTNLLAPGPVSRFLESIAPYGLFIVMGLIVSRLMGPLITGPVNFLMAWIAGIFGLHLG